MKIRWLNILNFYQYHFQELDAIERLVEKCYLPVMRLLLDRPKARCLVNINGSLLDTFGEKVRNGKEVIENLRTLLSRNQVEVAATGKYHPIFPLIPSGEAERQLHLHEETLCQYLGVSERPKTVFLPELAYLPDQINFFVNKGYERVVVDESSLSNGMPLMGRYQLREREKGCKLLVRDREISEALGDAVWREWQISDSREFIECCTKKKGDGFVITTTDAEVFGHYEEQRWKLLAEIYDNPDVDSVSTEEIAGLYAPADVDTVPSSRATECDDAKEHIFYPYWFHPENRIHRMLWQLLDIAVEETRLHGDDRQNSVMDSLLSSTPFFWASCRPWWNGSLVEKTADAMASLLSRVEQASESAFVHAESIRNGICEEVLALNSTGKARSLQEGAMRKRGSCGSFSSDALMKI